MIEPRLKKLEAMAGTPNTLREFSMPMTSAASDTSRMNGYMTRVRVTVSAAFSGSKPGASSATSQGAERMPSTVMALKVTAASVAHLVGEPPGRRAALGRGGTGEHGDEGGRERAFGEQVAQQVRDAEGDGERVHDAPAAEQRGEDLLAREPEHAAAQHREPDDAGGPGVQPLAALSLSRPTRVARRHAGDTVALPRGSEPASALCR